MNRALKIVGAFFLSIFFAAGLTFLVAPLLMLAVTVETTLDVVEIQSPQNLEINFLDTIRHDEFSVNYGFEFDSNEELIFRKLILTDVNNKKEFIPLINKWDDIILEDWNNDLINKGILIKEKNSFQVREQFDRKYKRETVFFETTSIKEYYFDAQFDFDKGSVFVKYYLKDTEVHSFYRYLFIIFFSVFVFTFFLFSLLIIRKHI
jgi:hypothetical protein